MTGTSLTILMLVITVIILIAALLVAVFAVHQMGKVARDSIELTRHQSDLIAAGDPLAFQAISAMSQPTLYDRDSNSDESEMLSEHNTSTGNDYGFGGLEGDPFFEGTIFTPSVGRD